MVEGDRLSGDAAIDQLLVRRAEGALVGANVRGRRVCQRATFDGRALIDGLCAAVAILRKRTTQRVAQCSAARDEDIERWCGTGKACQRYAHRNRVVKPERHKDLPGSEKTDCQDVRQQTPQ